MGLMRTERRAKNVLDILYEKNGFAKVSKNLARYRSKNLKIILLDQNNIQAYDEQKVLIF